MVGAALVVDGLGSRAWSLILSGSAVLYGVVGWFHLGVAIDGVLLVGAITLGIATLVRREHASPETTRAFDVETRPAGAERTA